MSMGRTNDALSPPRVNRADLRRPDARRRQQPVEGRERRLRLDRVIEERQEVILGPGLPRTFEGQAREDADRHDDRDLAEARDLLSQPRDQLEPHSV